MPQITLTPREVIGGESAQGRIELASPAPAGGLSLNVTSSNSGVAAIEGPVTVPAAQTGATFPVNTTVVSTPANVTLAWADGGVNREVTFPVFPVTSLVRVLLSPAVVVVPGTATGTEELPSP